MKILIFTEGTILMHKSAKGYSREEIVKQVKEKEPAVKDYASYIPSGNAQDKISKWKQQGADILYLTSRKKKEEIEQIKQVLKRYNFPEGKLLFRKDKESYKDVVERIIPDILIEDDCESIGENEITVTNVKPEIRTKIKSILVKEFSGIGDLREDINNLLNSNNVIKTKDYIGIIIEESLENKAVFRNVKIVKKKTEIVTEEHKTPWIKQWTLHTVEIPEKQAGLIARELSTSLDSEHNWYADFKNDLFHYIIFRNKIFKVDRSKPEQYKAVTKYGLSLGIPYYQLDFSPHIKEWL